MKYLILVLLFCIPGIRSFPQNPDSEFPQSQELYKALSSCDYVETQFKGFDGVSESEIWKKADSFFCNMPEDSIYGFLHDRSYVIRYYAFLKLLGINDRKAIEELKGMMADSTLMLYWFNDAGGYIPFNHLVEKEYEQFIVLKYRQGGMCTLPDRHYLGDQSYRFPRAAKKKWILVSLEFKSLVRSPGAADHFETGKTLPGSIVFDPPL